MIVGVAIKVGDNIEVRLPRPARHHDCFAHFQKVTGVTAPSTGLRTGGENQGFYTHDGRYLDRAAALKHARRCKQKFVMEPNKYLFSEDVW
jgi:hypothetical protein